MDHLSFHCFTESHQCCHQFKRCFALHYIKSSAQEIALPAYSCEEQLDTNQLKGKKKTLLQIYPTFTFSRKTYTHAHARTHTHTQKERKKCRGSFPHSSLVCFLALMKWLNLHLQDIILGGKVLIVVLRETSHKSREKGDFN